MRIRTELRANARKIVLLVYDILCPYRSRARALLFQREVYSVVERRQHHVDTGYFGDGGRCVERL